MKAQENNDISIIHEEDVSEEQNEDMEGNYLNFIKIILTTKIKINE